MNLWPTILSVIEKLGFNRISAALSLVFSGIALAIFMFCVFDLENDLDRQAKGMEAVHKSFPINSFVARNDSTDSSMQKIADQSALLDSLDLALPTVDQQKKTYAAAYSNSKSLQIIFGIWLFCWLYLKMNSPSRKRRPSRKNKKGRLPLLTFGKMVKYGGGVIITALLLTTINNSCKWYIRQDRFEKIAALKRQSRPNWTSMMIRDSAKYYIRKMENVEQIFNKMQAEPLLTTDVRPLYAGEWTAACYALLSFGLFVGLSLIGKAIYKAFLQ